MKKFLLVLFSASFFLIPNAQYTKLFDFTGGVQPIYGYRPHGSIISDGTYLYGMTSMGGSTIYDLGVVYKIKPDGTGSVKLLEFSPTIEGGYPSGALVSDGTFMYAMSSSGGSNGNGLIFKVKPDGTGYAKLFDFDFAVSGDEPLGSLIYDGAFLYGTTYSGGTNNMGVIFKIKTDGTGFSKLLDFAGVASGSHSTGALTSDGTFLYGTTGDLSSGGGGTNDMGVIFKIRPDGTGFVKLLDFTGAVNGKGGNSLISNGNFLYGTTEAGGLHDLGVIFRIKPDGTGYAKLHDFTDTTGGRSPSSLYTDGTFLYGTGLGGINDLGIIFKIMTDGTGYSKLMDFTGTANGSYPIGPLISDGIFLYGAAYGGGATNDGVIFKYGLTTGIEKVEKNDSFSIYPNPATNLLTINLEDLQADQVNIYNITGKLLIEIKQPANNCIDISKLAIGCYITEIKSRESSIKKMWIKM